MKLIDNLQIDEEKGVVLISVNPKIYTLDIIHSACYVMMDKAYITIDGDPSREVIVRLRPIQPCRTTDLEKLGRDFNNELINYAFYKVQVNRNNPLRILLLQNSLREDDKQ